MIVLIFLLILNAYNIASNMFCFEVFIYLMHFVHIHFPYRLNWCTNKRRELELISKRKAPKDHEMMMISSLAWMYGLWAVWTVLGLCLCAVSRVTGVSQTQMGRSNTYKCVETSLQSDWLNASCYWSCRRHARSTSHEHTNTRSLKIPIFSVTCSWQGTSIQLSKCMTSLKMYTHRPGPPYFISEKFLLWLATLAKTWKTICNY